MSFRWASLISLLAAASCCSSACRASRQQACHHWSAAERAAAYITYQAACRLLLQVHLAGVLPPGLLFFEVQLGALLGQEHPLLVLPASISRGEVNALLRGLVPSSRQAFIVDLGSVLQWAQELHRSLSRQAASVASRPESEEQTEGSPPIRMPASLAAAAQYIFRLAVGAQALQLAMCMSMLLQLAGVFPAAVAAGKHQEDTVVSRPQLLLAMLPWCLCWCLGAGVGPHQGCLSSPAVWGLHQ